MTCIYCAGRGRVNLAIDQPEPKWAPCGVCQRKIPKEKPLEVKKAEQLVRTVFSQLQKRLLKKY